MVISVFDMSVAFFHGKVRKVIRVLPPKGLRKKGRIWKLLLKSLYGTRDASPVFATYVHEGLSEHGFRRNAVLPCLYWCAVLEALGVHWVDIIFSLPGGRANDLEQLMREAFKVKICERVRPGFFFAVEFLHRKVACNTEGFSWTLDAKHTLAIGSMARNKSSKRSGTFLWLQDRKRWAKVGVTVQTHWTTKRHSNGRNSTVRGTGQTSNTTRNEGSSEIHVWSHAHSKMYAPSIVQVLQQAPVLSWT